MISRLFLYRIKKKTMKKIVILVAAITLGMGNQLFAGKDDKAAKSPDANATVSGIVVDKTTGEALPGVLVTVGNTEQKVYTDLEGKFEIANLVPGSYDLTVSYISYLEVEKENLRLSASNNELETIQLEPLAK
jgi:hypothetical protein